MLPPYADYGDITDGPWEIQNCEILVREDENEEFTLLGECNTARINITTNKIRRKVRNKRTRVVGIERTIESEATLELEAMQYTRTVRSLQLQGNPVDRVQVAGPWSRGIKSAKKGGIYFVDKLNIENEVTFNSAVYDAEDDSFTDGAVIEGVTYKIVDAAAGGIQLLGGFNEGDCLKIAGTASEVTEAMKLPQIDFGTRLDRVLEVAIRGLAEGATPFLFDKLYWTGSPSSIDLIGGDDFSPAPLTGSLLARTGRYGRWQRLTV